MRQRGRKTTNTLAVIDSTRGSKPAPLASLPDAESGIWARVVGAMPPDWLGKESYELLAQYCRLAVLVAHLDKEIAALGPVSECDLLQLSELCDMRDKRVRLMLALARSLRLTTQSRVHPVTAGRKRRNEHELAQMPKPWDDI